MTLIKSISGIRGTIGGQPGDNLTPQDIIAFATAFGTWVMKTSGKKKIVIGRDGRISGPMVTNLVIGALQSIGVDVVDTGLSTTPTVEVTVPELEAGGGIILTASHNPKEWNALKLLNDKGEFISGDEGLEVLRIAEAGEVKYVNVDDIGTYTTKEGTIKDHIDKILALELVDTDAIAKAEFHVVVDAVNSTGGIAVPQLLEALGVKNVTVLNGEVTGRFAHNPEPLPENLSGILNEVSKKNADLGIVVDPDVDRLALVSEDGSFFGEEYTLVAIADYVLSNTKGSTVSNLSSSRALRDITEKHGCSYSASAVGEVHVVKKMKDTGAVIGGEGNGGVIYPELHYGRDALVGIALFLTHLAKFGKSCSVLRASYPSYHISKGKIQLTPEIDVDKILTQIEKKYKKNKVDKTDGIRIDFEDEWVHLRKSNTEPIIRIYAESNSETTAENIANQIRSDVKYFTNGE